MKNKSLLPTKKKINGDWVAIMDHERHDRLLQISPYRTRCLRAGEIHEFLTCHKSSNQELPINDVAYLGFGELNCGGVVEVGDSFYCGNKFIGKVLGFDETHFPNHYNIILQTDIFASGASRGFSLSDGFFISNSI